MTKEREALKLALEALGNTWTEPKTEQYKIEKEAITAIKEALAQPEQEPVAYFDWLPEGATHLGQLTVNVKSGGALKMRTYAFKYEDGVLMVYQTDNDNEYPGWREAKQCFYHLNFPVFPIPTAPSKRTWVGLTKDERLELYRQFEDCLESDDWEYEKAIEAKLKEKNT